MRANGSYVGRSAPEIDVIEATVDNGVGKVSLSSQWAPFNVRLSCFLIGGVDANIISGQI